MVFVLAEYHWFQRDVQHGSAKLHEGIGDSIGVVRLFKKWDTVRHLVCSDGSTDHGLV